MTLMASALLASGSSLEFVNRQQLAAGSQPLFPNRKPNMFGVMTAMPRVHPECLVN